MARFVPNEHGISNITHGRGGPVYKLVRGMTEATEVGAKYHAPVDTGRLRSSIIGHPPNITIGGVEGEVKANARHGLVVHQGRGAIRPVKAPQLSFYWKKRGIFYQTNYVAPRAGRPFLIEGLQEANRAFHGVFKIQIKKPWRTEGS